MCNLIYQFSAVIEFSTNFKSHFYTFLLGTRYVNDAQMLFNNLFGVGQLTVCKRQSATNAQTQCI